MHSFTKKADTTLFIEKLGKYLSGTPFEVPQGLPANANRRKQSPNSACGSGPI